MLKVRDGQAYKTDGWVNADSIQNRTSFCRRVVSAAATTYHRPEKAQGQPRQEGRVLLGKGGETPKRDESVKAGRGARGAFLPISLSYEL